MFSSEVACASSSTRCHVLSSKCRGVTAIWYLETAGRRRKGTALLHRYITQTDILPIWVLPQPGWPGVSLRCLFGLRHFLPRVYNGWGSICSELHWQVCIRCGAFISITCKCVFAAQVNLKMWSCLQLAPAAASQYLPLPCFSAT